MCNKIVKTDKNENLVNFFNCRTRVGCSIGHATLHTSWHTTPRCSALLLVELGDDWVADGLNLLLLVLELLHLCQLVAVQPVEGLVARARDCRPFCLRDLVFQFLLVKG